MGEETRREEPLHAGSAAADASLGRPAVSGVTPVLRPPPSKSDAHRALTLAAIFGAPAPVLDAEALPGDVKVLQSGLAALTSGPERTIDCADAGAPFRILLALSALIPGRTRFTGLPRLAERPHAPLLASLQEALGPHGLSLEGGAFPRVTGCTRRPTALQFRCDAAQSSQYATALLLAAAAHLASSDAAPLHLAPAGAAARAASVSLQGPVASEGYLALTRRWLERAGFSVAARGGTFELSASADGLHPPAVPIPGDWSSLGYLLLISWPTQAWVAEVGDPAEHPDGAVLDIFEQVGLSLTREGERARLTGELHGGLDASARGMPDAMLTLAALACVLPGPSTFRELGVLRHKESDRVEAMSALVQAAGGRSELEGDTLRVLPPPRVAPLRLDSRGDHRVAMSAATLAALAGVPLRLSGAHHVQKSFPTFWRELSRAGVTFELE